MRLRVVVIGSGAVGAACASALVRARLAVTVLADPHRSTTSVSGGHLLLQSKRPGPSLELARRSLELLHTWREGREEALQYRRTGSLLLAASPEEEELLESHAAALSAEGVPVERLSGAEARKLEPRLASAVAAATYCPLDAQVHPRRLSALDDARRRGLRAALPTRVRSIQTRDGRAAGVCCEDGELREADAVVLAAGPWSPELAATAGLHLPGQPRRGVLLAGRCEEVLASRPLLGAGYLTAKFGDDPCGVAFSFQQHTDGECVLGGSRELCGFDGEGCEALRESILACAARYLDPSPGVRWPELRVGFRPWMEDGRPRIGRCEVPGLYLACGHEGDGITLAAATAERVTADLLADLS